MLYLVCIASVFTVKFSWRYIFIKVVLFVIKDLLTDICATVVPVSSSVATVDLLKKLWVKYFWKEDHNQYFNSQPNENIFHKSSL